MPGLRPGSAPAKKRRGPYYVYTYKEKGKTVSRRLINPGQMALSRRLEDYWEDHAA